MQFRRATKLFPCLLSAIYFATNCAFAHLPAERRTTTRPPENTIWSERRRGSTTINPLIGIGSTKSIDGANSSLAGLTTFGTIRKIIQPQSPSKGTILHIQDIHQNLEAQTNIANALKVLIAEKHPNIIALEGTSEETIDLTRFQKYPRPQTIRTAANYLLRENLISGPVLTLLTTPGPKIIGIDDKEHYQANVKAYLESRPQIDSQKRNGPDKKSSLKKEKQKFLMRRSKISTDEYLRWIKRKGTSGRKRNY